MMAGAVMIARSSDPEVGQYVLDSVRNRLGINRFHTAGAHGCRSGGQAIAYSEHDVAARVAAVLDESEVGGPFTPEQTGLLDQYHAGGVAAVDKLIRGLALHRRHGDRCGSGFGGPARRIAEQTPATVLGIDITPAYVEGRREPHHPNGLR